MRKLKNSLLSKKKLLAEIGKEKMEVTLYQVDAELEAEVKSMCLAELNKAVQVQEKHAREDAITEVKNSVLAQLWRARSR